jgi:6-phosphogluconolactonase/glucosamine-6-phosphate isomerase/deaminase
MLALGKDGHLASLIPQAKYLSRTTVGPLLRKHHPGCAGPSSNRGIVPPTGPG